MSFITRVTTPFRWYRKLSLIKKIIVGILVIALIIFAVSKLRSGSNLKYSTDVVSKDTVVDIVSESGNITAQGQVNVTSPSNGVIATKFVSNGDVVKSGQKLFEVKSTATDQEKANAYSNFLQAKTLLASANTTLLTLQNAEFVANQKFLNDAVSRNLATSDPTYIEEQSTWLASEKQYKDQQQVISQAQASVNSLWLAYQNTQNAIVNASVPGTVANFNINISDSVNTTSTVLIIAQLSSLYVDVQLNEVDIPKVHVGQNVSVTVDAIKDKTYNGLVSSIDAVGTNISGVITYHVLISITDIDSMLRPSMTANISIETARHENVLTVANAAIKPYLGGKAVLLVPASKSKLPTYVSVKEGIRGITRTEILSGVTEGQKVVTTIQSGKLPSSSPSPSPGQGQ